MPASLMHLKLLLPFQVFTEQTGVARIVAETRAGSALKQSLCSQKSYHFASTALGS